jgi:outer membrane protein assembly factor BamA
MLAVCCVLSTAEASDHPCEGLPISGAVLDGCGDAWCADDAQIRKLLSMTDLTIGTSWTEVRLNKARTRLEKTGFFRAVEDHCQLSEDGVWAHVILRVFPNRFVRHVKIKGNSALFDSDVMKRMFLRPGVAFNPKDDVGADKKAEQEELIARRYARDGFESATVKITSTLVGSDGVDVLVTIDEGERKKVSAIEVVQNIEDETEDAELFVGPRLDDPLPFGPTFKCPRFSARDIRQASKLSSGDALTTRRSRNARQAVRRFLRSRGIVEPKVSIEYDNVQRRTRITVGWKRCWHIRFLTRFDSAPGRKGFSDALDETLLERLTFAESGSFDLDEAELSRYALESYYQQNGYLFADIELDYRRAPKRSRVGVTGVITYLATMGYPAEIRGISFDGNKVIDDDTLRQSMKTQTYDFFGTGGYLLVEQMFGDLAAIQDLYRQQGFYKARFPWFDSTGKLHVMSKQFTVERRLDGDWEIYDYAFQDLHFQLRSPLGESVIYLNVAIEEGPRSVVGEVKFDGQSNAEIADLRTQLLTQPGNHYSPKLLSQDLVTIEDFYQARGNHEMQLTVKCVGWEGRALAKTCGRGGDELCGPDVCDWRNVRAGKVELQIEVVPGPVVVVGEVFIRGNHRTETELIERTLPKPGEPLSQVRLDEAERNIRALGVFSEVEVKLIGLDELPIRQQATVVVRVQERRSQFVELRQGIETLVTRQDEVGVPAVGSAMSSSMAASDSLLLGPTPATPLNIPNFLNFSGVAWRDINFLGRALELRLPLKYGFALPEDFSDGNAWADAFTRLIEFSPTLFEPRVLGTDISSSTSIFIRYDRATLNVDEFEVGATTSFIFPFTERFRGTLSLTGSGIKVGSSCATLSDCSPLRLPEIFDLPGESPLDPKIDLDLTLAVDYLDNPIHPTEGFAAGARLSYIYAFSDLSAAQDRSQRVLGNYLKWDITLTGVVNVRKFLIVAAYFRYADSISFGVANRLPAEERYRLGGLFGVRGFADGQISPVDENGDPLSGSRQSGNSLIMGTLELRMPMLRRSFGELWLGVFLDWGGLAENVTSFREESFRIAPGIGIRTLLSGIAIRFDVGFNPFSRCRQTDDGSSPRDSNEGTCNAGEEPVYQTEFGLLYTF